MIPDTPEIVILLVICAAITGLLKLETLGEWVWRLRCAVSPSLDRTSQSTTAPSDGSNTPSEGSPSNDEEVP